MTSPNPLVEQLVARIGALGFGAPPSVPDGAITLAKLAPDVTAQLGSGRGGSVTVDPDDPDYLTAAGGTIAPDPSDPDYLTFT